MKKIIMATLWVALATALPKMGKAQDTSTIDKLLTYILDPLDKSQIPTQFLAEKGTIFLGMNTFNGTLTDNNVFVANLWRMMYVQLQQSYVGNASNPLPDIITVNNALQNNMLPNQPTPVPLLIGQYNTISDDAATNGLITYDSYTRQLYDVPNRPSSPYLSKNLFAACPLENYSITGIANIIIKSSLNYNNTGTSLSSVQIDFANGQGFVTIPLDVAVTAAYTDTGYYRWTIKATLSNNTVLQCYADYYVEHVPPSNNTTTYSYNPGGPNGPTIPAWGTIAPVGGVHSGGIIEIVYSNKNRSNTLRKPLIVVKNMDAYNLTPQVQNRPYTIEDFIDEININAFGSNTLNSQLDDIAGYDLVFINFEDGMDGIVRNAAVVQEAINLINANKVFDNRSGVWEQNVVLGMGTGGLNARYALANMEKNFSGSNTRLLITHDAPHRGQNIALGLQYLVKFINKSTAYSYNLGDVFPEHAQTLTYFKSKVCKDVLIYQTDDNNNNTPVVNSFIENVYQPMVTFTSGTQPYRFVATSLGNECATPLYEAGRRFMDFGTSTSIGTKLKVSLQLLIGRHSRAELNLFSVPLADLKYETIVFARAIPSQNDPNRGIAMFRHVAKITLVGGLATAFKTGVDEAAVAATSLLPIDGVPGSFNTLMDFRELQVYQRSINNEYQSYETYIATLFYIPTKIGMLKFSLYGVFKTSEYNWGIFATNYTALPVGSALDVSPFNANTFTEKYVNGTNASYPSKSNSFIAQETVQSQRLYNNASMRFTARNARFIFKEMENLSNAENCSIECVPPASSYTIIGPSEFCTSGNYTISGNALCFASVTWSIGYLNNHPNIASLSCTNCISTTLTKLNNGTVLLIATVTFPGTNTTYTYEKYIGVGVPVLYGWYNSPNNPVEPLAASGRFEFNWNDACLTTMINTNMDITANTTVTWEDAGNSGGVTWYQNGNNLRFYFSNLNQWAYFRATATNSCGSRSWIYRFRSVSDNCSGGMMMLRMNVSPNPTTNEINVELTEKEGKKKAKEIVEIRVINRFGELKQKWNFSKSGNANIRKLNVGNLPADVYTIMAFDGKIWVTEKFIKQ